jgi:Uma2 family endonuclease
MGSPCRTLVETFWLKKETLESALLPDIIVHCNKLDPGTTSIDNPVVVVEVLSPGTESRDRLEKWRIYQQLS